MQLLILVATLAGPTWGGASLESLAGCITWSVLVWLLGRLMQTGRARPWPYLRAGTVAVLTFGTAITLLTLRAADISGVHVARRCSWRRSITMSFILWAARW